MRKTVSLSGFLKIGLVFTAIVGAYPSAAIASPKGIDQVVGNAEFQKRKTLVQFEERAEKLCAESKPYWVLVLKSGAFSFELSEIFSLGADRAPASIEVSGVIIRPGERILVEGSIDNTSRDYGIISDVTRVDVVMDTESVSPGTISVGRPSTLPSDAQVWHCHGALPTGQDLLTEVWYAGQDGNSRVFHIRSTLEDRGQEAFASEILNIDHAVEFRLGDAFAYRGHARDVEARLTIARKPFFSLGAPSSSSAAVQAEGTLEIKHLSPNFGVSGLNRVQMSCVTEVSAD